MLRNISYYYKMQCCISKTVSLICNHFLGTSCNQAEPDAFICLTVLISTLKSFTDVSFP